MKFLNLLLLIIFIKTSVCQNGLLGLINPRDIADITQMAMSLGAQTVRSNQELLSKPGRPEVKPLSSDLSASELIGQGITNLMNPEGAMKLLNQQQQQSRPINPRGPTLPIEKRPQIVAESTNELPREFSSNDLFNPERILSTFQRPRANAAPSVSSKAAESIANIGGETAVETPLKSSPTSDFLSKSISPEMASSGRSLMNLATSFLRGASGNGPKEDYSAYGRDYGSSSLPRFGRNQDIIPNIRQVVPGANDNFGIQKGQGCLPFVGEFMQIAYGNCVKQADQKTFDVWGREFESALTGKGLNLFRASKETCRMITEREQCGQLRKAISNCDIINSIQIAMNMQRALERCDQVTGIIDQNPQTIVEGMSGLINGEVAQGFLNNFLG